MVCFDDDYLSFLPPGATIAKVVDIVEMVTWSCRLSPWT